MAARPAVWLDCDPGHDDAVALMLALFAPAPAPTSSASSSSRKDGALEVLGVSSVHGNSSGTRTFINAVRLLSAYKVDASQCSIWRGADVPLLRQAKADVAIHGEDGLGGVECLPDIDGKDDFVHRHLDSSLRSSQSQDSQGIPSPSPLSLMTHLLEMLQNRLHQGLPRISIIATGPLTNIALLIKMCPGNNLQLLEQTVDKIVIMGGAAGVPGNRSPLAEWNILVDPEAASIVFDSPLPVVMAGLNITHQAIFTVQSHRRLLLPRNQSDSGQSIEELHRQASPIRRLVSSALTFFGSTYESEFGFDKGPPVHDMLAVAYVLDPTLFYSKGLHGSHQPPKRYAVKVDTSKGLADGATIVDFHNQWGTIDDGWQAGGRNVLVLEHVDVSLYSQLPTCVICLLISLSRHNLPRRIGCGPSFSKR